jgi:hypothetical protein
MLLQLKGVEEVESTDSIFGVTYFCVYKSSGSLAGDDCKLVGGW